jgi:hypothetical protein
VTASKRITRQHVWYSKQRHVDQGNPWSRTCDDDQACGQETKLGAGSITHTPANRELRRDGRTHHPNSPTRRFHHDKFVGYAPLQSHAVTPDSNMNARAVTNNMAGSPWVGAHAFVCVGNRTFTADVCMAISVWLLGIRNTKTATNTRCLPQSVRTGSTVSQTEKLCDHQSYFSEKKWQIHVTLANALTPQQRIGLDITDGTKPSFNSGCWSWTHVLALQVVPPMEFDMRKIVNTLVVAMSSCSTGSKGGQVYTSHSTRGHHA